MVVVTRVSAKMACFTMSAFLTFPCSLVPTAAPRDVAVEVFNTTVLRVSWTPAPPTTVRGHLGGYDVSFHGLEV